jgi:LytS/YehU family sensor histidine kinase
MLMAESRFVNLRLQMNPHFLFNSLNSIQHLVVTQQHAKAYQYLTLFSHLLRSVLQHAEKDFISLDTELDMLKMYLELEGMRFKDSFHYEIIIDETLDQEEVMVPSLLLQPFAENAIWHGLLNKDGDKRLTISFGNGDECITCRIIDNGIGREKAEAMKQQQVQIPFYESKGIRIVKERLGLLEQRTGKKSGIKLTDLYADIDKTNATGTMVEIDIPFYYSEEHDQSTICR